MNSIEQNIFETFQHENDDSDDESGYYIANITRRPQELTNELDETNVEDSHNLEVEGNVGESSTRSSMEGVRRNDIEPFIQLPPPPQFNQFNHEFSLHEPIVVLPYEFRNLDSVTPYHIFRLFFSNQVLRSIINNTNKYGQSKNGNFWTDVDIYDILIWLGIIIYGGLYKMPTIRDIWNTNETMPIHSISLYMPMSKFERIKNFLHISDINGNNPFWYSKVEPLASHINNISKSIYIPSSNLAVDEMIVRFSGRSAYF